MCRVDGLVYGSASRISQAIVTISFKPFSETPYILLLIRYTPAAPTPAAPRRNTLPFLKSLTSSSTRQPTIAPDAGADPGAQHYISLQVAATVGNIDALEMVIEPSKEQDAKRVLVVRRPRKGCVQPTTKALPAAVKAKHFELALCEMVDNRDIPDMATLQATVSVSMTNENEGHSELEIHEVKRLNECGGGQPDGERDN
ncbi:hypothetical protein BDV93DRAFT_511501 [Ceratobasidium sp. AG-I]|nr:hypothetical protein BDV93DRAFT_511501 [Ceratobasidium sp. AG-I]